jgi:hypothetical protein
MKKFLFIGLFLLGCWEDHPRTALIAYHTLCSENTITARSEFILTCAKNANPMSDEEGEDLVQQCEETAEHLFCPKVPWAYIDYEGIPCSQTTDESRKQACNKVKPILN